MRRSQWLRPAAALAALALITTACGGDEPAADDTETETAAESPTGTETDVEVIDRDNVNDTLAMGTLVPQTGDLAALGPPQQLAYELAVQQINEAGGVLGTDVQLIDGDSGTREDVASSQVDQHLRENVDAILGAASSRISLSVIDKITGNEVVQCSPSNTSSTFTDYEDSDPGYYFRTAPPDKFQGPALAQLVQQDGFSEVGVVALNDAYGQGFAEQFTTAFEDAGGTVSVDVPYDPGGTEFSADVQQLADADPPAVVLISFPDTGAQILSEMIGQGLGPADIGIYTADGMQTSDIGDSVNPDNPSVMEGLKGTAPTSQGSQAFTDAFQEFTPEGTQTIFSAHAYDCANVIALAAEVAGTDDPREFRNEMVGVTTEGEKCDDFPSCKEILDEGGDIDYDGATGANFVEVGEPGGGVYDFWELVFDDGEAAIETIDSATIGEVAETGG